METLVGTGDAERSGTPPAEGAEETRARDATVEETVVVVDDYPLA